MNDLVADYFKTKTANDIFASLLHSELHVIAHDALHASRAQRILVSYCSYPYIPPRVCVFQIH
jgi:hypothetical protein